MSVQERERERERGRERKRERKREREREREGERERERERERGREEREREEDKRERNIERERERERERGRERETDCSILLNKIIHLTSPLQTNPSCELREILSVHNHYSHKVRYIILRLYTHAQASRKCETYCPLKILARTYLATQLKLVQWYSAHWKLS